MGLGQGDRGYAMAALLVALSVMAVMMSAAMPVWSHMTKREKEEELIWRGQQYARAIGLFQRKFANTFPPNVDVLVEQKFLRKKYKDPITGEDFQPIPANAGGLMGVPPGAAVFPGGGNASPNRVLAGPGARMTSVGTTVQGGIGIQGVVSKSTDTSIKIFNGRTKYNEWAFVHMVTAQGIQAPGVQGGPQMPGVPPGAQVPFGVGPDGRPAGTFTPLGGSPRRPGVGSPQPPMMPGIMPGAPQNPQGPPRRPPGV